MSSISPGTCKCPRPVPNIIKRSNGRRCVSWVACGKMDCPPCLRARAEQWFEAVSGYILRHSTLYRADPADDRQALELRPLYIVQTTERHLSSQP